MNHIDLNLLHVFKVLMRERSVTAAAARLRLGQPAVSHALARLRTALGDPLLVRAGRQMEPTARAVALLEEIGPALDRIEQSVRTVKPFDPASEARQLSIAMSDDLQVSVLPDIVARLTAEMPATRLVVRQTDYVRAAAMLDRRDVSVVVGYLDKLPASTKVTKLSRVGYRVLTADGNVPGGLDDYCARDHVLVTFAGDLVGYVDETLERLGTSRRIVLSVSSFAVLPYLLKDTDRLATVPAHVASTLDRQGGLVSAELPFASPEFDISMAWPAVSDRDPAERLLRLAVAEAVRS